jgi:hypothetical protein
MKQHPKKFKPLTIKVPRGDGWPREPGKKYEATPEGYVFEIVRVTSMPRDAREEGIWSGRLGVLDAYLKALGGDFVNASMPNIPHGPIEWVDEIDERSGDEMWCYVWQPTGWTLNDVRRELETYA